MIQILHLLFGIPTKSDHYFQYDYDGPTAVSRTEIGAGGVILNIDSNGDKLSISRSKWNKNINEQIKDIYPQIDDVEKMRRLFSNFFFTSTKMISDIQGSISLDKNIRNDLIKFIDYAKLKGILDIYFSTNGILLKKEFSKKLIESGLTRIQISIDAFTQDTYNKVRPGGDLNKIIENVNNFLSLKKELNADTPLVRVNFVKTELNEHELDTFVKLWKDKVDMIGIQEFVKPTKVTHSIKSKKTIKKKNFKCSFPFKQLVINNEKEVLPCCTFWGEELKLQKINKPEDLLNAWQSEKMRYIRKKHLEGKYQEIPQCRNCIDGGLE